MTNPAPFTEIKGRRLKKSPVDENVWELAVQRARQLYEQFDHVAVSFSGGKDSTATLHAMLAAAHEKPEERLPLRVIFWDEECILSLIHISEPTRREWLSRMPSSA